MNSNSKCNQILNDYLMLDKGERVPLKLSLHILFCKKCKRQIKMLSYAEKKLSEPLTIQTPITDDSIKNIMQNISPHAYKKVSKKLFPLASWIIDGLIMIALILIPFIILIDVIGKDNSLVYALFIAACITGYCIFFMYNNMEVFIKKLSARLQ